MSNGCILLVNRRLKIRWGYDASAKTILVELKQLQDKTFQFPLIFKIKFPSGQEKIEKVIVNNASASFKIKSDQKPTSIIADPDTQLLAHFSIKEK